MGSTKCVSVCRCLTECDTLLWRKKKKKKKTKKNEAIYALHDGKWCIQLLLLIYFLPEPTLDFLVPRTFNCLFLSCLRCWRAFLSTFSARPERTRRYLTSFFFKKSSESQT